MSSSISSPFGELPTEWCYQSIKQHTDFLTGPAFDSKRFNTDQNGAKLARGINLTKGSTRWGQDKTKYWCHDLDELSKFALKVEDILIGMDGSLVGHNYAYLKESDLPALLVQRVARLRTKEKLDSRFLFYMFGTDSWLKYVEIVKTNSGIPHISNGDIKNFLFPFPPHPEQKKIAAILSSVDEVIEKTQAQINKLKDLKTGMMQELLSPREGSPQALKMGYTEFKDSPVGRIPVGWDVVDFKDIVAAIYSGWSPSCEQRPRSGNEWGILKTTAVVWSGYTPEENKVLSDELSPVENAVVGTGDLLITRKGPRDRVGVCVYVESTPKNLMVPDTVFRVLLKEKDNIEREYVSLHLSSEVNQRIWDKKKVGLAEAQVNINHQILNATKVALPPKDQQQRICSVISALNQRILGKQTKLVSNQNLKKALMQDLLTGKVRVQVDQQ